MKTKNPFRSDFSGNRSRVLATKNQFITLAICAMLSFPFGEGWGGGTFANNLQIGTPTLPSTTTIQFTIQWDNSWNVPTASTNWDAVWVFVKYQDCATQLWTHVGVTGSSVSGGVLQIDNAGDGLNKGVFIRRSANGTGDIASATVVLNMTTVADLGYNYQVFGIEMVYVPTGSFYLGDGGTTANRFTDAGLTNPYQVTSNGALTNVLYESGGTVRNIPAAYPEGYDAFYCMKYEITQEQYVNFLNTLTFGQQVNRMAILPTAAVNTYAMYSSATMLNRNGIRMQTPDPFTNTPAVLGCDFTSGTFNQTDDGQNIAMNYMSWNDLIAYLDWAVLRPMTELEYEKACRGTLLPVAGEFPWGDVIKTGTNSGNITVGTDGYANETVTNSGIGLCAADCGGCNGNNSGPLRVGFAATATTIGRTDAGATYYGIMEMGGNLDEQTVNVTSTTFTTESGDGALSATGNSNTPNPPTATRSKGSHYNLDWAQYVQLQISYRATTTSYSRDRKGGGRGVRMP